MSKINDGGPAFPNVPDGAGDRWANWDTGMTLRDYFAAKAMEGLIMTRHPDHHGQEGAETLAVDAFIIADAMLAARGAQ